MNKENRKLIDHYRYMVIEVLYRKAVNHRDYGKNYHYFIEQAGTAMRILRKKYPKN